MTGEHSGIGRQPGPSTRHDCRRQHRAPPPCAEPSRLIRWTARLRGKHGGARVLFPLVGFFALTWFLLRCIPKPRRMLYPCQRVAAPLGFGFLAWLTAVFGATTALRRLRTHLAQRRPVRVLLSAATVLLTGAIALSLTGRRPVFAEDEPANRPIGAPRGIHPGRVVWVHDPDATQWAGMGTGQHWDDDACTDPVAVDHMFTQGLRKLTGKPTPAAAWDALFRHLNAKLGRGSHGYVAGERIAIKVNFTTCYGSDTPITVNPTTWAKQSPGAWAGTNWFDHIDPSPQLTLALLRSLVSTVGVAQADIAIGDPTAFLPKAYYDRLHAEFPNLVYLDYLGGPDAYNGGAPDDRTRVELSSMPFGWSTPIAVGKVQDYIPEYFAQASYLIDFAVLKSHDRAGITVCAKNFYGALLRKPSGDMRSAGTLNYLNLHAYLPQPNQDAGKVGSPGRGKYRALVDLMGHRNLGGKSVLYLIDGLYGGDDWAAEPSRWSMPPFNGDWPSSLFLSEDPVAIDSVAYDFLVQQWPDRVLQPGMEGGAEDYLIEAALADNPPSGTFYDPEHDGTNMPSLGVHEHWNNPADKLYSGDLGTAAGIELIAVSADGDPLLPSRLWAQAAGTDITVRCAVLTPDQTYCLQCRTNLATGAWSNLCAFTASTAVTNWHAALPPGGRARFYRLLREP